jgi:tRNA-intron endonuclease
MHNAERKRRFFLIVDDIELGYCDLDEESLNRIIKTEYGQVTDQKLLLNKYEAFYILQENQLQIFDEKGDSLNPEKYYQRYRATLNLNLEKLLVYGELRQKGYRINEIQTNIFDFMADDGSSRSYYIKILPEGGSYKIEDLNNLVKISIRHKKEPIIAIVERNGEVIFYRLFQLSEGNIEGNN